MSLERQALTALKWTAAARLLSQIASWAITLLVVRLLAPSDYGLMALVTMVISIGAHFSELGLGQALVQAKTLERPVLAKLAGFIIALHLLLAALVVGSAPLIAQFFHEPRLSLLLQVAALQFVFAALGAVPQAMAARALQFKWLARIEFSAAMASSFVTLALALSGFAVWSLVLGMLAGSALRNGWLCARGERVRPDFDPRGINERLQYGAQLAFNQLTWLIVNQADILIGGRVLSKDALGAYSVSMHLATLPMQKIMSVINQVAFTTVARLQEERERLAMRLLQATRLLSVVSVPLLWGISAVAPEFVLLVLGEKWASAVFPLQVVALVVPLRMMASLYNVAVAAVGSAGTDVRNTLTTAVVWPTCFLVGAQWGVNGLAASWLAAIGLTMTLNFPRTCGKLHVPVLTVLRMIAPAFAAGLLMLACVHGARWLFDGLNLWLRLPLLVSIGAAIYAVALTLFHRAIWPELRRLAQELRG